jgi:hypothetical protein
MGVVIASCQMEQVGRTPARIFLVNFFLYRGVPMPEILKCLLRGLGLAVALVDVFAFVTDAAFEAFQTLQKTFAVVLDALAALASTASALGDFLWAFYIGIRCGEILNRASHACLGFAFSGEILRPFVKRLSLHWDIFVFLISLGS